MSALAQDILALIGCGSLMRSFEAQEERISVADKTPSYGAEDIQILEGLQAVRKRPGMYIGSTGSMGLHHLVWEIVDNSVDEAMAGFCNRIDVTVHLDNSVTVTDNGRGIPVAKHPKRKMSTLEVVMTILHAGGKFGGGGYKVSGGLHGVGVSVVNALSERLVVEVKRDGEIHTMEFSRGKTTKQIEVIGKTKTTGTKVTFWPDPEIFQETTVYDHDTISARLQETAFLSRGLKIVFTDERELTPRVEEYCYQGGINDFVKFLNEGNEILPGLSKPIYMQGKSADDATDDKRGEVEVSIQWNTGYGSKVMTFANNIYTIDGGTHLEGFRTALTRTINDYARKQGILKDKDQNLTGDDTREGLTAVISVKLADPQFEGQTKAKLGSTFMRNLTQQVVAAGLQEYFEEHPNQARAICNKAISASKARTAARKAREATRRKGVLESASMPGKLRDCSSRTPSECEIFIVEGDSAGGSAVGGRDPERQAILPIRGKILNVEKARLDRALSSDTIRSLITAFGTGIGEDFDISKLRYGKIVIMADADVDGQHIATLLLTLLFRYMRPLIEGGHTFIAMPPLYRIKWTNAEHEFAYSDKERDELLAAGAAANRRLPKEGGIQRYKGLGEMNDHELWETTMDPEHRILKQVTLDEAADADETFTILMGDDVDRRRTFIQRNATDVRFLDI